MVSIPRLNLTDFNTSFILFIFKVVGKNKQTNKKTYFIHQEKKKKEKQSRNHSRRQEWEVLTNKTSQSSPSLCKESDLKYMQRTKKTKQKPDCLCISVLDKHILWHQKKQSYEDEHLQPSANITHVGTNAFFLPVTGWTIPQYVKLLLSNYC